MSEQYYVQEDVLPNTPDQVIENIQAQSSSLANVVPEVATALNQTGEALGQLYAQAQAAGNTGALALISAAWERTELIANQVVQMDALKQSALDAIATINEERLRVTEELSGLEEAINEGSERHPLLKDYAAEIRHDEAEAITEEIQSEAFEWAGESIYDSLQDNIGIMTGLKWNQISHFVSILEDSEEASPLECELLRDFILSLNDAGTDG